MNKLRDNAIALLRTGEENISKIPDLWNRKIVVNDQTFQLSEIYPEVDPSILTRKEFTEKAWKAIGQVTSKAWYKWNNVYFKHSLETQMTLVDKLGELSGRADVTFANFAAKQVGDFISHFAHCVFKRSPYVLPLVYFLCSLFV